MTLSQEQIAEVRGRMDQYRVDHPEEFASEAELQQLISGPTTAYALSLAQAVEQSQKNRGILKFIFG